MLYVFALYGPEESCRGCKHFDPAPGPSLQFLFFRMMQTINDSKSWLPRIEQSRRMTTPKSEVDILGTEPLLKQKGLIDEECSCCGDLIRGVHHVTAAGAIWFFASRASLSHTTLTRPHVLITIAARSQREGLQTYFNEVSKLLLNGVCKFCFGIPRASMSPTCSFEVTFWKPSQTQNKQS